jgi:hypothetical protein
MSNTTWEPLTKEDAADAVLIVVLAVALGVLL